MNLESVYVEDYKSIHQLEWNFDKALTCLVGQNESGKSNIMEIFKLLSLENIRVLDPNKHTRRSSDRFDNAQKPHIKATYKLSTRQKKTLSDSITKYSNQHDTIKKALAGKLILQSDLETPNHFFYFEDKNGNTIYITEIINNAQHLNVVQNALSQEITTFESLEEGDLQTFTVNLGQLKNGSQDASIVAKLLKITNRRDFSKIPTQIPQLRAYLKRVNKSLKEQFIKKYYKQDDTVAIELSHDSGHIYVEITDSSDAIYELSERSAGFQYYIGLLIEAATISDSSHNVVFLLDEPGAKLHPSGQRDLLKYFEELSSDFNIIYTTHSPFLINRLHPQRVQVVHKDRKRGTVLNHKGFTKNWRPLRSALGLNLQDSFYYSEKVVLMEGPEDVMFLTSLIDLFNRHGVVNFNTDLFTFMDAGSASNLPSMVQILLDESRPMLVFMDSDEQKIYNKIDKKAKSNTKTLSLLEVKKIESNAVSIEDLLPWGLYVLAASNYLNTLCDDEVLSPIKKFEPLSNEPQVEKERYKQALKPHILKYFTKDGVSKEELAREKTPISKLGIAREFGKILVAEEFNFDARDFRTSIKLVKEIAKRIKILNK